MLKPDSFPAKATACTADFSFFKDEDFCTIKEAFGVKAICVCRFDKCYNIALYFIIIKVFRKEDSGKVI